MKLRSQAFEGTRGKYPDFLDVGKKQGAEGLRSTETEIMF